MAVEVDAALTAAGRARSLRPGDVPDELQRRYYTDRLGRDGVAFYLDATSQSAIFRDHGDRLSARAPEPAVLRHMIEIARHRGWTQVRVEGAPAFRREAWLAARRAGVEVLGYRPSARDLQELERSPRREAPVLPHQRDAEDAHGAAAVARRVAAVVGARIEAPADQARVLAAARQRIADWLERGALFEADQRPDQHKSRSRDRA